MLIDIFWLIVSLACRIEPAKRRQSTRTSIQILPERGSGAPQIDPKSIPGHSRDAPWRTRSSGVRLGSASRRPRWVSEPPRRSPRPPPGTRKSARERPGAHRGDQNRCQVASGIEELRLCLARRVQDASLERSIDDFARFPARSRSSRTLRSTAPVGQNQGSARHAASRVDRAMRLRKSMKIDRKIEPKSPKIATRGRSGALFAQLLSLEAGNIEQNVAKRRLARAK